jgi:nucleotide-binding universal stress UspA family protein
MTKVLIGVDGSDRAHDAIAFGRALALAAGAPVVLATAHVPEPRVTRLDRHIQPVGLRDEAERLLARLSLSLLDVDDLELLPLADHSAARALQGAAERTDAAIVVVGSSHLGRLGRVLPGSTGERLLHGAPCPVTVVPHGFHAHGLPAYPVVGCAYRPDEDGEAALGVAEDLALALSGSLRVMQVVESPSSLYITADLPLNIPEIDARNRADAERALHERVERLDARLRVDGTVYAGRTVDVLCGLSKTVDVMVLGSRGYGPLKSVLLGGVSGRVICSAACPVIVVPRGVQAAVGSLFAPPEAANIQQTP